MKRREFIKLDRQRSGEIGRSRRAHRGRDAGDWIS